MKAKTISLAHQVLALAALIGVLAPRVATAQQDESGKFTLSTEVHWADAVLPAGVYTFSVDTLVSSARLYVYKEGSPAGGYIFTVQAQDTIPASTEGDHLVLERKNGGVYVTELQLGSQGLLLYFPAPKSLR